MALVSSWLVHSSGLVDRSHGSRLVVWSRRTWLVLATRNRSGFDTWAERSEQKIGFLLVLALILVVPKAGSLSDGVP